MLTFIEDEEHHEFSTVSAATVKMQQKSRHLSNIDFTRTTDGTMPLEDERGVTLMNGYAMQPNVSSSVFGKGFEFGQTSRLRLCTPSLDPMPGPGPYFLNHQFPGYVRPEVMIDQGVYYQDTPYERPLNYQYAYFDQVHAVHPEDSNVPDFRESSANEQYDFQNTHEETFLGPNYLLGPRPDSDIDQSFQNIDPQLLER
jgi:hypothetical protein